MLASCAGLSNKQFRIFEMLLLPVSLMKLLALISRHMPPVKDLVAIEYFAGAGQIAKAYSQAGLRALTFEKHPLDTYVAVFRSLYCSYVNQLSRLSFGNTAVKLRYPGGGSVACEKEDLCSSKGMVTALGWLSQLKAGGLAWLATVCST